tara:strand:- start:77 stop:598 length:522 start_codon:yes stop_codon:yes gene_type:complete
MIYLPHRAVFIHIPRTAGNSITSAIASTCAGRGVDIILGTGRVNGWEHTRRHRRAQLLKDLIEEWEDIYKFAIHRPEEDRVQSAARLIERDVRNKVHEKPSCPEPWRRVLKNEDKHYWDGFKEQTTDWYIKGGQGEDLGVELYRFSELNEKWSEICDKCDIPQCILPRLNSSK